MPPKRAAEAQTGPEKKRQRLKDQRTIRVGGSNEHGNSNLPSTIDVEKFAQSRLFEINSLQQAMKSAKAAGTVRAFQSLPRALRRRAASHNIRRLPVRLRAKALSEVPKDAAKPKKKSRKMMNAKKRMKKNLFSRAEILQRRRNRKIWLETHIWHAKRMHMTEIWGHRLAMKPTEKCFRASYRSSYHGTQIHDASYHQYLLVSGSEEEIITILKHVCIDPTTSRPWTKRYTTGIRECSTTIYKHDSVNRNVTTFQDVPLLGPVTIIWRPNSEPPTNPPSPRQLLIRLHPTLSLPALSSFLEAKKSLDSTLPQASSLTITPLIEKSLITFEVMGARAAEVLKGVLKVTKECFLGVEGEKKKAVWDGFASRGGAGMPEGMVLGLEVWDPRLTFPPKLVKDTPIQGGGFRGEADLVRPSVEVSKVDDFWDAIIGKKKIGKKYSKADIDKRRGKLLIPGTRLSPIADDTRIPLLLSQRTLSSPSSPSTAITGFTLTLPSSFGLPFFLSLVHTQSRVAGLEQRSQQYFEAGVARYPEDYPFTVGFREFEARRREEEQGRWERRPKGKREEWAKLGTDEPWRAAFEKITRQPVAKNWIIPAGVVQAIVERVKKWGTNPGAGFMGVPIAGEEKWSEETKKLVNDVWSAWISNSAMVKGGLVRVRLLPVGRGAPKDLACIYRVNRIQFAIINKLLKGGGEKGKGEEWDVSQELGEIPSPTRVIGRVTSGAFSLKRGRGYAVGAVTLPAFLNLIDRDIDPTSETKVERIVLVRNRESQKFRVATLELLL